jgi:hypothetical protein
VPLKEKPLIKPYIASNQTSNTSHIQYNKLKHTKLDKGAFDAIFIGYPDGSKAWKFYCPETWKSGKSRNIIFDEYAGSSRDCTKLEEENITTQNSTDKNLLIPISEIFKLTIILSLSNPVPSPTKNTPTTTNLEPPSEPKLENHVLGV